MCASWIASTTPAWSLVAEPDGGPLGRRLRYGRLYRTASQPRLAHSSQILFSSGDSLLPPAPWVSTTVPLGALRFRLVGDARNVVEVHDPSLNNADTGP